MPLYIIRPGETNFDTESRVQGALNLPLTERGRTQVDQTIERLKNSSVEVIYTSPNEPALSTARAIAEGLDVPCKVLDDLVSFDLGLWQGLSLDEIRRKQPRVFRQWEDAPESVCPPEGETCDEVKERICRALRKPLKRRIKFAVVASEPLASMIADVIRGDAAAVPGPLCGCCDSDRVEVIDDIKGAAAPAFNALRRW